MRYSLRIKAIATSCLIAFATSAVADDVRVITPVDEDGNPTGPSQTIVIANEPDSSVTGHMVDQDRNQASPDFQIPDATQPEQVDGGDDLVPMDSQ